MNKTYQVREFAQLAGVTVRALHFYDQTGLLKPGRANNAKYRQYRQDDLLRLQQILTLKYLGFSLREIEDLLASPAYDARRSLAIQKEAIDRRIEQMQNVSKALEVLLETPGEIDWELVTVVIRAMTDDDRGKWLEKYYTPEARERLAERQAQFTSGDAIDGTRKWMALIDAFREKQHLPPDHPDVQTLAAEAIALVEAFTGGDPAITASLKAMYQDYGAMPQAYRLADEGLMQFMGEAQQIYRDRSAGDESA